MLEERLSSTTYSPAEAALTLISFVEVELAAGGASAEARFFKLFSLLCNRVFGPLSQKDGFKHEFGGWLSRHAKWERPPMSLPSTSSPYGMSLSPHSNPYRPSTTSASSPMKSDPVIKLLGARTASQSSTSKDQQFPLSLIEAFAKKAEHRPNVRYAFPFPALPKSTQAAWIALIETALGGMPTSKTASSENSSRLLGSLFRVKPLEQNQLRLYQQTKAQKKEHRRPLQLSPMYSSPKSPATPTTPSKEKDSTPNIMLSMLEYYLLVFIRYPLAAPPTQSKQPQNAKDRGEATTSVRRTEPYGESVYYYLFQEYVNYYIPVGTPKGHSSGFPGLLRPSELFIRLIIEFWLEGENQLAGTTKAMASIKERRPLSTFNLNMSYDLVKSNYVPPPYQIPRCFHKLIARAISDGAVLDMVRDIYEGSRGSNVEVLSLSPAMTILQLPFYNYVRNAFRHASIHAKQSSFYSALNDWLLWLEPWNTKYDTRRKDPTKRILDTVARTQHGTASSSIRVSYPKESQRSLYKPYWEPYIASNLHLYTIPLAIFLRRARELEFSPREYRRSFATVSRVFRVFSPEVVAVINRLLSARQSDDRFSGIVRRHEQNLGAYAPPESPLSFSSCQDDMHNLLEEINLQHLKKLEELDIFDRTIARIEGFFGQGASGEEKELQVLFNKAKVIVGFPDDYEVMPSSKPRFVESKARNLDGTRVDRTTKGLFSDSGRQRLIAGEVKCNPQDVGYVGDVMLSRPQSHEIAFLVPLLVNASIFCNAKLGIRVDKNEGFDDLDSIIPKRFNFRFLADYRNICFICLVSWIWNLIRY